jgi:hypothetical protein
VAGHPRHHQADELAERPGADAQRRAEAQDTAAQPQDPDPEVGDRPEDCTDGRPEDPDPRREQQRADDDPAVVEHGRQGVAEEPALGHEDLAEHVGDGEQDRRHEHQSEQVDVQGALLGAEAAGDQVDGQRREDEQDRRGDADDQDGESQDRAREVVGGPGVLAAQGQEDRHERGGQAARDEDAEGDLGDREGRVVGIELGTGAERPRLDDVPHEAEDVAAEGDDREQDRAVREEPAEDRPERAGDEAQPRLGRGGAGDGGVVGHRASRRMAGRRDGRLTVGRPIARRRGDHGKR